MAHSDFSISVSATAVDVTYTSSNSEPRGKLFGLIFTISMLVLVACAVLFRPGKHGNPSVWHDLTSDPPASLLFFIMLVIVPLIGCLAGKDFATRGRLGHPTKPSTATARITVKHIPWLDFSNRTSSTIAVGDRAQ